MPVRTLTLDLVIQETLKASPTKDLVLILRDILILAHPLLMVHRGHEVLHLRMVHEVVAHPRRAAQEAAHLMDQEAGHRVIGRQQLPNLKRTNSRVCPFFMC